MERSIDDHRLIRLDLTIYQVRQVLEGLGELKFRQVASTVKDISDQARPQIEKKSPEDDQDL